MLQTRTRGDKVSCVLNFGRERCSSKFYVWQISVEYKVRKKTTRFEEIATFVVKNVSAAIGFVVTNTLTLALDKMDPGEEVLGQEESPVRTPKPNHGEPYLPAEGKSCNMDEKTLHEVQVSLCRSLAVLETSSGD
ncbi:hypothetical protein K1T71_009495 [Dendrolimus kikuchii]|uniref:Uncharacterized protein n=1 Tax=Dendrolimus kikuchii TaxID=765133 RepID=A0ACC1CUL2_9NEOP|nr:hypothetical protein K1T71_009495 [Dendrolimus kikuchii]